MTLRDCAIAAAEKRRYDREEAERLYHATVRENQKREFRDLLVRRLGIENVDPQAITAKGSGSFHAVIDGIDFVAEPDSDFILQDLYALVLCPNKHAVYALITCLEDLGDILSGENRLDCFTCGAKFSCRQENVVQTLL